METQKSIAYCKNDTVFLNTGLSADAFAKARLSDHLGDAGFLFCADTSRGKQTAGIVKAVEYTAREWKFSGTEIEASADGSKTEVLFSGSGFFGRALSEILAEKNTATAALALFYACCAICSDAAKISAVGAGGILLGCTKSGNLTGDVLFLPAFLFQNAAEMRSDALFSELQGCYINKQLSETKARNYLLAVLSYRAITLSLPFASLSSEKRSADNLDNFFEPISLAVNGIDTNLAREIDARLYFPQKDFGAFPLELLSHEMGLEAVPAATDGFVSAVRAPVQRKKMADPAVFAKRRARASSFRTRQALWRRFVRSHGTSTGIFAVVCIVAAGLIAGYVHNRSLEITTQGLTGFETVETFYTGLQNADVMSVHNSATGEADKTFSDTIASIYVTNKSRASYDQKSDTKPLEEWLFFHNDFHFWLYGMTHFSINGTSASLHFSAPQKYMRPEPVNAAEGAEERYSVSYFMVANSGENELSVIENTDTVNLVFKGNRWLVASVKNAGKSEKLDFAAFCADVKAAEEKSGGDVLAESEILREKYAWIPEKDALLFAAQKLSDLYALKSARAALEAESQ